MLLGNIYIWGGLSHTHTTREGERDERGREEREREEGGRSDQSFDFGANSR